MSAVDLAVVVLQGIERRYPLRRSHPHRLVHARIPFIPLPQVILQLLEPSARLLSHFLLAIAILGVARPARASLTSGRLSKVLLHLGEFADARLEFLLLLQEGGTQLPREMNLVGLVVEERL